MSAKIAYFIISEDDVRIGESESDQFRWLDYLKFDNKTDFYYKERLQELLDKYHFDSSSYDEHVLAWYTSQSTIIPMNLMNDLNPKQLLQYSFSDVDDSSNIDYNRIAELSMVNIFTIPLWVKSFFVMRFPRIVTMHLGTGMIRGILNENSFKNEIHLVLQEKTALLLYTGQNQVKHYNSYEYSGAEDLLYYVVNMLTQMEALEEKAIIYYYGDQIPFVDFEEKLQQLKISKTCQATEHFISLLKHLASCV